MAQIPKAEKVKKFIAGVKLATISTTDSKTHQPESALIAFAEDDNLNLYFQTSDNSRKYANLVHNGKVAFVIGFDFVTVQYEGVAKQTTDKTVIEKAKELFIAKESPADACYFDRPGVAVFKVSPSWLAYSDYTKFPSEVIKLDKF